MRLAKLIMLEKVRICVRTICVAFFSLFSFISSAQDNSPYSRYGLGDLMPSSNITTRGMAGISAGYADYTSINFNNPASYSNFFALKEKTSGKLQYGRVILDVGINFSNRTLIEPNTPNKFTSSDLLFSYLQVGIPLKQNWGLSFGIRPVSRISYLINQEEVLKNPIDPFDTISNTITQFKGSGGSYLPSIGTGYGFNLHTAETNDYKKTNTISLGVNAGYLFGSRENTILRNFIDTSTSFYSSEHTTNSSFGNIFFNSGLQYQFENLNKKDKKNTIIRFGISGNWKQNLKGAKDSLRQTYVMGGSGETIQIDSVYEQKDISGEIVYPGSLKVGFVVHSNDIETGKSWLFGADYTKSKWSEYRFFGQTDAVQDSWQINVGGQFYPRPKTNYFSRVVYRLGFYTGKDYIKVQNELPLFGISYGMGLPIGGFNRLNRNEFSMLNLAFDFVKRGNNDNLLKENMFRVSAGFNLSDLWFIKKKYD
ncbi:MAG: hypothetical protein ACXWCZ_00210 [Flavisolibacter sp.]